MEEQMEENNEMEGTEKRVAPAQRRHHGLSNQGATCYLNSVLQLLFMTTEIHHRLDPQEHTDLQLRNIFKGLKKRTCGTKKITATFGIKNVYEQRDAAECLEKILRLISTEASEVFRGQLRETTTCSEGHIINEETNPFWTLPLSLRDAGDTTYSVQSSFERIFQEITYTGKNKVYCYECDRDRDATSRCEMVKDPQILILLLKRFELDRNTRSHFKSHCCVKVPRELQLKEKTYRLYGMVDHMGSIRGGHYTATVRSEDNTWYDCNDSHVSEIKQQLFAEDGTFSSRSVYLLMYSASESKVSSKTRQNEEDEAQTGNDKELLNHQTEGEEDDTERNLNDKSEGWKSIKPSKRRLDGETETEEQGAPKKLHVTTSPTQTDDAAERQDETSKVDQMQTDATECQQPAETTSEDLTEVKEEQGEYIDPEELNGHKEPKRNTDDEETTHTGQSAEDDGKMRKERKEESLQAGEEEGGAESVETDTSVNNHTTVGEAKSSEDGEAQEAEEGNTQDNSSSEEGNETREEDASVNVGEQLKDSCEHRLDEERETETQEQRELKMSCKMRQNETESNEETTTERDGRGAAESQVFPDTNKLDELRQDDVEPKRRLLERDAEDEDQEQIRPNDTYELQEKSDEALSSQTGGEEGDAETGKIVLDDEVRSETEPEREPLIREKLRDEKDDEAGEPECERIGSHDKDDESDGETGHIRDMTTDGTASEVENTVVVEAQDNLDVNPTISRWRRICIRVCPCIRPNNAEDEGQTRKDEKKERLQARGEEGGAETVETDCKY